MEKLVTADWVAENLNNPNVRVVIGSRTYSGGL
jgi:hypothetical protein